MLIMISILLIMITLHIRNRMEKIDNLVSTWRLAINNFKSSSILTKLVIIRTTISVKVRTNKK